MNPRIPRPLCAARGSRIIFAPTCDVSGARQRGIAVKCARFCWATLLRARTFRRKSPPARHDGLILSATLDYHAILSVP